MFRTLVSILAVATVLVMCALPASCQTNQTVLRVMAYHPGCVGHLFILSKLIGPEQVRAPCAPARSDNSSVVWYLHNTATSSYFRYEFYNDTEQCDTVPVRIYTSLGPSATYTQPASCNNHLTISTPGTTDIYPLKLVLANLSSAEVADLQTVVEPTELPAALSIAARRRSAAWQKLAV